MSENKRVLNKKMGNGLAVRDRKVFVKLQEAINYKTNYKYNIYNYYL